VLAGDVGGTKTDLALFELDPSGNGPIPPPRSQSRYSSQEASGLVEIARDFLSKSSTRPEIACFGVAGPVIRGRVNAPNLSWDVDAAELRRELHLSKVALLNDLEAAAHGVVRLPASSLRTLQRGEPELDGAVAVIAAGTGLGEASLIRVEGRAIAIASEGGHADFGPTDDDQIGLLRFIREKEDRVSYERVLAGPGLARIYDFLRASSGQAEPPQVASRLRAASDRSAEISRLALENADAVAVRSLRLFAKIYGAEAGNVALRTLCFGGLFVAGGIAPKILPFLEDGVFLGALRDKGRLSSVMERIPVHVVLEEKTPLLGAASYGATL
jgi:glucokinase